MFLRARSYMIRNELLGFNAKIVPIKPVNEELTLCKCYVLALGKNRNYSHISKETADKAVPTIYNVPVVGHLYVDEDGEYHMGGHDVEIMRDENGVLRFQRMTVPVGVVPEGANIRYEDVIDSEGNKVTYQVADVILWTGRYPKLLEAIYDESIYFGQSMEINVMAAEAFKDDNKYTDIKDFSYSALCLLGKSDNPDYHVEPCFPDSRVEPYHFDYDKFSAMMDEFKEKVNECFQAMNMKKGGEKRLTREVYESVLAEFGLTQEDLGFELTEEMTEEELREKLTATPDAEQTTEEIVEGEQTEVTDEEFSEEVSEVEDEPVEEPVEEVQEEEPNVEPEEEQSEPEETEEETPEQEPETDPEQFSKVDETLSYNQKMDIVRQAVINLCKYENGLAIEYYLNDCDDTYAYLTECQYGEEFSRRFCRVKYTISDGVATLEGEFETMYVTWLTKAEVEELETKRAEYDELKSFQMERLESDRIKEYNAVISEFSDLAGNEEFSKLVEDKMSFETAETLRERCFAIRGRTMVVSTTKKPEVNTVPLEQFDKQPEPYGGFFSKYPPKSGRQN